MSRDFINDDDMRRVIGKNIRRLLRDSGKTQVWLAQQIGSTREAVNIIIAGKAAVSLRRVCEIAAALEVEATDLLLDDKDRSALNIGREALTDPVRADILRTMNTMSPEAIIHIHYILQMMSYNTTP